MEFTIAYFWAIKLVALSITLFLAYKGYKHKFRSIFWNVLFTIAILFGIFNPIKLQPTTDTVNNYQSTLIENRNAVLPPMVRDNTFSNTAANTKHISKDDLK